MLRKLIIAVFVLGFTMTLSGTALSGELINTEATPKLVDENHPRVQAGFDDALTMHQQVLQPSQRLDEAQLKSVTPQTVTPQPPAAACGYEFYHNGSLTNILALPDYFVGAPWEYEEMGVRFTVPEPAPGSGIGAIEDTVKGGSVLAYLPFTVGDPTIRIYLYDTDGFGFPGSKLDSVDVDFATYSGASGWADGTFPNEWVFVDGEEYHITATTIQNSVDDTVYYGCDDGTGHDAATPLRNHTRLSGGAVGWFEIAQTLSGNPDLGLIFESFVCRAEFPFSDCFVQEWYGTPQFVWGMPDQFWSDEEYSMRFDVTGQDTVVSIDFYVADVTGAGFEPASYVFGDDDLILTIYGDDGTGLPDPGNVLFTSTVAGGSYSAYPAAITVPVNQVISQTFHVGIKTNEPFVGGDLGDNEFLFGDDFDGSAMGRGASYFDTDGLGNYAWVPMTVGWGIDEGFIIDVFMCRDEFSECQTLNNSDGAGLFVNPVPDANEILIYAQAFASSGLSCELRSVQPLFYSFDTDPASFYSVPTDINIKDFTSGDPAVSPVIASGTYTVADYVAAGYSAATSGFLFMPAIEFTGLTIPNQILVEIAPQTTSPDSAIRVAKDSDGPSEQGLGYWVFTPLFGGWLQSPIFGSDTPESGLYLPATICCIPIPRRPCSPGEDWFTLGHDYQRTYASENALGDAWCDLTVNWTYEDPFAGVAFTGPTVYDDKVICAFGDRYVQFDLATGAQNWTAGPIAQLIGASLRCAPTIVETTTLGTVAFVSGGDQLAVAALDWATGAVVTQRDFLTDISDFGSTFGQTRWGNFMVVDIAGTESVVWTTDDGWIRAASLTAPQMTITWQTQLDPTFESGATDGGSLYYCTWPAVGDGDVYSLDITTGAINWQLSATDGLQAVNTYTLYASATETFKAGVSLDNGDLYVNSDIAVGTAPGADFPADGLLYKISAATGSIDYSVASVASLRYAGIVHDIGQVFVPGLSHWLSPPTGGALTAHSKSSGVPVWTYQWPDGAGYWTDGVLSCEGDGKDDILFLQNDEGFLGAWNARTGNKLFHRRFSRTALLGANGAMSVDDLTGNVHLTYANQWGDLVDFTQSTDRPRLELTSFNFQVAVEFGAAASFPVTIGPAITNTGCTPLNVTDLLFDTNPTGVVIPNFSAKTVSDEMLNNANNIADMLTDGKKFKPFEADPVIDDNQLTSMRDMDRDREIGNRAAAAFPGVLNAPGYHGTSPVPGAVAPDDTVDVILDVIQPNVLRGPNPFYMTIVSDDHDYFAQDGFVGTLGNTDGTPPEVSIVLIGGCLTDSTDLNFGIGGANFQIVSNSGRLADDVWGGADASRYGINIDGHGDYFFAGAYIHGISEKRIAINMHDVVGDDIDEFISWQPDPNWCDNECKPALEANVNLGSISTDGGATYTPIIGNRVCASGIDSVQNFDDGAGNWDWTFGGDPQAAPFDPDSTMGLQVNSRTVGALDVPELENVAVEVFEFNERNGNDIPGWAFNVWIDTDAGVIYDGVGDTMIINRDVSALWDTNVDVGLGPAYGFIKIPYGCIEGFDGTPLKNVWTLDTDNSMYSADRSYLDSTYFYSQLAPGEYSMPDVIAQRDQSLHGTLVEHDFTANGTFTFGIGVFGFAEIANSGDPNNAEVAALSDIVNKWAGFGRGDVNNDQGVNLADIIYLADYVNGSGNGPYPFMHLGDVNADLAVDGADVQYLIDYYFCAGPCPAGAWTF